MSSDVEPVVGQWYSQIGKGREFEVLALDDDVVEIQYFDGDLEALELDAWRELELETIEPPEDWTGPLDDVERDDLGLNDDDEMEEEDWTGPLGEFNVETERRRRSDETPLDDWGEGYSEEEPGEEE